MISELADAARARMVPSLSANTKILRSDLPGAIDWWDRYAPLALHRTRGTRVPGSIAKVDYWAATVLS